MLKIQLSIFAIVVCSFFTLAQEPISSQELDRILREANKDFNNKAYSSAYQNFSRAADLYPNNPHYNFYAGYSAEMSGNKELMHKHYMRVIKADSRPLYENLNYAFDSIIRYYLDAQNPNEALVHIRKAKLLYPDKELYSNWEIDALIAANRSAEAINALESAIALNGGSSQTNYTLAYLYLDNNNLTKAKEFALKAVAMDPENFDAYYILGHANYNDAAQILGNATAEKDNTKHLELVELSKTKFLAARSYYQLCYLHNSRETYLFTPMSTIYGQLGMPYLKDKFARLKNAAPAPAEYTLENMGEVNAWFAEVNGWFGKGGELIIKKEQLDATIDEFKQQTALHKNSAQNHYQLAYLYAVIGKLSEAKESGVKAIDLSPEDYMANFILGLTIYLEATRMIKEANNESDDARYEVLKKQAVAKFDEARPYLEVCYLLLPENSSTWNLIANTYDQLGIDSLRDMFYDLIENNR